MNNNAQSFREMQNSSSTSPKAQWEEDTQKRSKSTANAQWKKTEIGQKKFEEIRMQILKLDEEY